MNDSTLKAILLNWLLFFALIALLFWIWRAFGKLAAKYDKLKWLSGLAGVVVFFLGSFVIGGLMEKMLAAYVLPGLLKLPAGLVSCWGLYMLLKSMWVREK